MRRRRTGHFTWARPTGFAVDSPLEGTGFEPSVPRRARGIVVVSVLVRANFSVGRKSSRDEMSPSGNLDRATRYRWFESGFLQRRVNKLSVRLAIVGDR